MSPTPNLTANNLSLADVQQRTLFVRSIVDGFPYAKVVLGYNGHTMSRIQMDAELEVEVPREYAQRLVIGEPFLVTFKSQRDDA